MRSLTVPFALTAFLFALGACGDDGTSLSSQKGSSSGSPSGGGSGGSGGDQPAGPGDSGSSGGSAGSDVAGHCVDALNSYRAKVGAAPLARSSSIEAYALAGAQSDSQSGQPHGHFISTQGGGVAFAENEVPGWPLAQYGSTTVVVDQGLQRMFGEGPGGGHYDNMTNAQYTHAGCGIVVTGGGDVWVTMDFR